LAGVLGLAGLLYFLVKRGGAFLMIPIGGLILGQLWIFRDIATAEDFLLG
jgi:hypothetical protein